MARVQIDIDVADLRRRLGLSEEQLPDNATSEQISKAFEGMPRLRPEEHTGIPADDMVMVERDEWQNIQRERQIAANRQRDSLIDDAIRRGKFAPARRSHYVTLYDTDPEGAARQIAAMADGVVPTQARGSFRSDADSFLDGDAYPTEWLPDVHHQHDRVAIAGD